MSGEVRNVQMDDGTKKVAAYYDSISKDYSRQYEVEDLKTRDKYPQNYFRLQILIERLKASNAKAVYEIGTGEGTPLAVVARNGFGVAGCDISEKMVERTQHHLEQVGADPARAQLADIQQFETLENQMQWGPYDAVVAFGVMPHVVDDVTVMQNMRKLLSPQGRVFVEFRNKLFSLFTLNRYTKEFILDDLLTGVADDVKDAVASELDKRMAVDLPPARKATVEGGISYDEIRAKYHNPFEVVDFMREQGFNDVRIHWYHYHPAPPMLESSMRERFWEEASKMEMSGDKWRGYFLCSAFVVEAS